MMCASSSLERCIPCPAEMDPPSTPMENGSPARILASTRRRRWFEPAVSSEGRGISPEYATLRRIATSPNASLRPRPVGPASMPHSKMGVDGVLGAWM